MGTNYYWEKEPAFRCQECGHVGEVKRLHIGKSSAGWCFSLHVYPDEGITNLDDWKRRWASGGVIKNEYGDTVTFEGLLGEITNRTWGEREFLTQKEKEWYTQNHAVPGPRGLARHDLSNNCIGHGEGPWDLIEGDFS